MEFEQLGRTWRDQPDAASPATPDALAAAVGRRAAELDRLVRLRDRLETWGAIVAVPIFTWVAVAGRFGVSRVGAALLAVACAFIPFWLRRSRRPAPDLTRPIAETLRAEVARLRAQQRLLGTVAWWYLGPLGLGVILFLAGPLRSPWLIAAATIGVVAFCGTILQLNRRVIRTELEPRMRELESWITALRED